MLPGMSKRARGRPGGVPAPPPGGRTIEDTIAAAGAAAELLADRTRQANEAAANLRAATREHEAMVRQVVRGEVDELIGGAVTRGLETLGGELQQLTAAAGAQVRRDVAGLYQTLLEIEREGGRSIAELLEQRLAALELGAVAGDRAAAHPDQDGGG
jgi:hypothetical protein